MKLTWTVRMRHWWRRNQNDIKVGLILGTLLAIFWVAGRQNDTNTKILHLQQQNHELAIQNQQLAKQNKNLSTQINTGINGLHEQMNCVFIFFSQPGPMRANSSITNPQDCIIKSTTGTTTFQSSQPTNQTNSSNKTVGQNSANISQNSWAGNVPQGSGGSSGASPPPSTPPPAPQQSGFVTMLVEGGLKTLQQITNPVLPKGLL